MVEILNLWIINNSGLCLLHRNFSGGETVDETLFGGFLTAIVHMTKDMNIGQDKDVSIEKISMGSTDIHYRPIQGAQCALVLSVDRKVKDKEINSIITSLAKEFSVRYKDQIDLHSPVRISDFLGFEPIIDTIVESKGKSIKIDPRETEFQQVLKNIKNGIIQDPSDGINQLFELYNKLESDKAKEMISKSMKDVEKLVKSADSSILTNEQKKLFEKIIKGASALMKGEKFLLGF